MTKAKKAKSKAKPVPNTIAAPPAPMESERTPRHSIVVTLEIFEPDAQGNRRVLASGAPDGELPELRVGVFADRHALVDRLWMDLRRRNAARAAQAKAVEAESAAVAAPEEETAPASALEPEAVQTGDQLVAPPGAMVSIEQVAEQNNLTVAEAAAALVTAELRGDAHQVSASGQWQMSPLPVIANDPTLALSNPSGPALEEEKQRE